MQIAKFLMMAKHNILGHRNQEIGGLVPLDQHKTPPTTFPSITYPEENCARYDILLSFDNDLAETWNIYPFDISNFSSTKYTNVFFMETHCCSFLKHM